MVGLATRVWEHARLAEATTEAVRKLTAPGVAGRRRRARHRRAAARAPTSRPSTCSGRPPRSGTPVDVRLPARPASRAPRPGTSSRGAWSATPAAGTSSGSTPTAARSGSSGSPGSLGDGPPRRRSPASYDVPPGTDVRAIARRLAPAPPTERGDPAGPQGRRRRRCAAAPPTHRGRRRRPGRPTGVGPRRARRAGDRPRRRDARATAPDVVVEAPAGAARATSSPGSPPSAGADGVTSRPPRPGAKDQVARLLTAGAVPPRPRARSASTRPPRALGVHARAGRQGPQGAASCAGCPGGYPDDLIDVDLDALEDATERPTA